ncbi:hypothetical protein [Palleronia sp. LCG004]|uniref:hypothetical protein n=1 Tax=Palleronia sp. LCG004 TaxID=3079304 RepID=UPI0029438BCB|nr:hypothetical protein [Palleronia sp. LCG004]WOI55019.1 hypothetical protein RVY76_08050 [Palleronia sp. LCG004]
MKGFPLCRFLFSTGSCSGVWMKGRYETERSSKGDRNISDLLRIAVENYEDVLVDLHDMKSAIRSSEKYSESETRRIVSMVSKTIQIIYDERKRLNDLEDKQQGPASETGIDYDRVRSEIRSRLDRIRNARMSGAVST